MKWKGIVGAVVVMIVALFTVLLYANSLRKELDKARAKVVGMELKLQGWENGRVVKEGELGGELARLNDELARAKKAGARPLVAGKVITKPVRTTVPCDESGEVLGHSGRGTLNPADDVTTSSTPPTPTARFSIVVSMENLLVDDRQGDVYATGKVWAHLTGSSWNQGVELPVETMNVEVSDKLRAALQERQNRFTFAPRKFNQWRTGWTAGLGACVSDEIKPCAFVGLGVQF